MGKTSTLQVATQAAERDGVHVIRADLSTASSMADVTNRLLTAAMRSVGRTWRDLSSLFVERLKITLSLRPDPATGLAIPTLDARLRSRDPDAQRQTLGTTLDLLDDLAGKRVVRLGIILDEFQEIHRLEGETAEWHLRGVMEQHRNLTYLLAGSRTALIHRMVSDPGRAFYKLMDVLHMGPMDDDHFARWIDERIAGSGRAMPGLGEECLKVAGPRTRDVVQLARAAWNTWSGESDLAGLVDIAFRDVLAEEDVIARTLWNGLTPHQQDVLRAVAGAQGGLTSRETLERFSLPASGTVSNTVQSLVTDEILTKVELAPGYDFESPFFRGWVVTRALPDLGIQRPATWRSTLDS